MKTIRFNGRLDALSFSSRRLSKALLGALSSVHKYDTKHTTHFQAFIFPTNFSLKLFSIPLTSRGRIVTKNAFSVR
jgi:hypothetical protein